MSNTDRVETFQGDKHIYVLIRSQAYDGRPIEKLYRKEKWNNDAAWETALADNVFSPDTEWAELSLLSFALMLTTIWQMSVLAGETVAECIMRGDEI